MLPCIALFADALSSYADALLVEPLTGAALSDDRLHEATRTLVATLTEAGLQPATIADLSVGLAHCLADSFGEVGHLDGLAVRVNRAVASAAFPTLDPERVESGLLALHAPRVAAMA